MGWERSLYYIVVLLFLKNLPAPYVPAPSLLLWVNVQGGVVPLSTVNLGTLIYVPPRPRTFNVHYTLYIYIDIYIYIYYITPFPPHTFLLVLYLDLSMYYVQILTCIM